MATASLLDRLVGVTPEQRDLLKKLKELKGSFPEELSVKLDRIGDNIMPDLNNLVARGLVNVDKVKRNGKEYEIYQTAWNVLSLI